jgi:hypothetical protein
VADTVKFAGALPLAGVTESHAESLEAVKSSTPPPPFVTVRFAGMGFVTLPCTATNKSLSSEATRAGRTPFDPQFASATDSTTTDRAFRKRFMVVPFARTNSSGAAQHFERSCLAHV